MRLIYASVSIRADQMPASPRVSEDQQLADIGVSSKTAELIREVVERHAIARSGEMRMSACRIETEGMRPSTNVEDRDLRRRRHDHSCASFGITSVANS